MKTEDWGIHWFRRDLRIPGNEALKQNWRRNQAKTLGIFCFDTKFLSRSDFSHNRFAFFLKTLKALKEDLRDQGGDLLVVDCSPQEAFQKIFEYCRSKKIARPALITWSRDYEPYARARDEHFEKFLAAEGIPIFHSRDHLLFEPHEILKSDKLSDFYQIYSPFARKWFDKLASSEGKDRLKVHDRLFDYYNRKGRIARLFKLNWSEITKHGDFPFSDSLDDFEKVNKRQVTILVPEAGFFVAFKSLQGFKSKLKTYNEKRDFPASSGTSRLSLYIKNGSLSVPQVIRALDLDNLNWQEKSGASQFLKELVWREFYYSILFHRPDVEKKSFLSHYENIKWGNNEAWFTRWKEGTTGFPIVDAGMRELSTTGWMHNRVRMIVASFLTKDLLIDWRWGEKHFMKELLDGDLAPNNGGWQWAASTGCDPQPYFRIFNPWLQSAKFDLDGSYIKKFVPELKSAPSHVLHDPEADRSSWNYPKPLVNHSQQRVKAIRLYKFT